MDKQKNYKKKVEMLGFRTPDRFRKVTFKRQVAMTARPRALGGHR